MAKASKKKKSTDSTSAKPLKMIETSGELHMQANRNLQGSKVSKTNDKGNEASSTGKNTRKTSN
jgi:hypothetical protein